jgi:type I restriction enzyme M protein
LAVKLGISGRKGFLMAQQSRNGKPLGFEDTLWKAADKLRGSMDASEYKHVVLGLVLLKYIDDAFTERREKLAADLAEEGITGDQAGNLLESRDEYTAEGVFWVPPKIRWEFLQSKAKHSEIEKLIDSAMDAVEVENPSLRGVLPKNYARPSLDVRRLGELVDLIAGLGLGACRAPGKGPPRPSLRVLPRPLCLAGRKGRRGVLHTTLRGETAGRDD